MSNNANGQNTTTNPIKCLQLNIYKNREAIHSMLNEKLHDTDIIFLQEPGWGFIGTDPMSGERIEGPVGHAAWTPILPVSNVPLGSRPGVMTYYKGRPDFSVTLRSDIAQNPNLQVIDITQHGSETVTIVNIYNNPGLKRESPAWKLRQLNLPEDRPVILTGDWNLHHPLWSARHNNSGEITTEIVDWLTDSGYSILNEKGVPTWSPHAQNCESSTLDLTFTNARASNADTIKEWAINTETTFGSDHAAIQWTLDAGRHEIPNITGTRYNIKDVDPRDWQQAFRQAIAERENELSPILTDNALTNDYLDRASSLITEAMQQATAATAKIKKNSPKAKPWWTPELTEAAKQVNQARMEAWAFERQFGIRDRNLKSKINRARNHLKRLCKFQKAKWATDCVEKATTGDIWNFRKWSQGVRNYPTPAIDRGPNTTPATTHTEKCDAIRDELFQPPPPLTQEFEPNLTDAHPDDFEHAPVTWTEVRDAIFNSSTKTAPGFSQIPYTVIRWAWGTADNYILALIQKCMENGYHPKDWRRAIAVAIRKPGKPDYSKPRAYRLIQLLECLGKVLEHIVAKRLSYFAGKANLIPGTQFGGKANYSTTDAILSFTNDVEVAWSKGKVTTALTFDIKGYFDFVNHRRLLHELRRKKIPIQIVRWVDSFLTDRQAAVCLDGIRGEMKEVENGIPQGSPVSPILAAFYTSELMEMFEQSANEVNALPLPDDPTNVTLFMYVDDGKLFVSSRSLETNVNLLKTAYRRADNWLRSVGLAPDLTKRELMHYTRRPKDGSPAIVLTEHDGTRSTITTTATVKWLGVFLDRKLLFNHHVKNLAARAEIAVRGLTMLANTVKGLSQAHLRHLYKACIIPVMSYACAAWWNGKKVHSNTLERIQHRALRLIVAAFRTTPIKALEIEASIPPIAIALNLEKERAAIRFNKLSVSNPVIQRLPDDWRNRHPPSARPPHVWTPQRRDKTIPQLQKVARLTSPNNEFVFPHLEPPWRRTTKDFDGRLHFENEAGGDKEKVRDRHVELVNLLSADDSHVLIYTDGSVQRIHGIRRTGAGYAVYNEGRETITRSIGLGAKAVEYDGELAGMVLGAKAATNLAQDNAGLTHLHFFTDNSSVIDALKNPKPAAGQLLIHNFTTTIHKFLDDDPRHSVDVSWIPSHMEIDGNTRADELAKAGAAMASHMPFAGTTAHARQAAKERLLRDWTRQWKAAPKTGHFAISDRIPPAMKPTPHFRKLDGKREVFGRLVQCRTGHGYSGEYYRRFVPTESTQCQCGEALQTREHILRECPLYDEHRPYLRKVSEDVSLPEILGTRDGISALITFLEKSGAFSKNGRPREPREPPKPEEAPDDEEEGEGGGRVGEGWVGGEQAEEGRAEGEGNEGEREGREEAMGERIGWVWDPGGNGEEERQDPT